MVQNTQSLQYEQMQIALQTTQNQALIETPLKAKQLMTAHFNLAILTGNPGCDQDLNAPKPEATAADPGPSTSGSEQETICKTPYRSTGAVSPTCR